MQVNYTPKPRLIKMIITLESNHLLISNKIKLFVSAIPLFWYRVLTSVQGDKDKNQFSALKWVTKGQSAMSQKT